jgi:hypothetical protein
MKTYYAHPLTIAILAIAVLTACGDKAASNNAPAPSLADATNPKKVAEVQKTVVAAALPKADKTTPAESYFTLDSGNPLMFAYLALAKLPVDYPEVARTYSRDFANTQDEFKKKDLLKALTQRIDEEITKAGGMRYMKMTINNPIGKYDFASKGFPLDDSVSQSGSYRYFNDNPNYKLTFTNGDTFRVLKVEDEASARAIEDLRVKYTPMTLSVYAYLQDADVSNKTVKAEIVKIVLSDKKGAQLAAQ